MSKDMGQSLEGLTMEERIKRYRQYAEDAGRKAHAAADEEMRAGLLSMAGGWHTLANMLERHLSVEIAGSMPLSQSGIGEERP